MAYTLQQLPVSILALAYIVLNLITLPCNFSNKRCGGTFTCWKTIKNRFKESMTPEELQNSFTDGLTYRMIAQTMLAFALFVISAEKWAFFQHTTGDDMSTSQYQAALAACFYAYVLIEMGANILSPGVKYVRDGADANMALAITRGTMMPLWALVTLTGMCLEIYTASCKTCTKVAIAPLRQTFTAIIGTYIVLDCMGMLRDYCRCSDKTARDDEECCSRCPADRFELLHSAIIFLKMAGNVCIVVLLCFFYTMERSDDHVHIVGIADRAGFELYAIMLQYFFSGVFLYLTLISACLGLWFRRTDDTDVPSTKTRGQKRLRSSYGVKGSARTKKSNSSLQLQ